MIRLSVAFVNRVTPRRIVRFTGALLISSHKSGQLVPSPPHTPQQSISAFPPRTPAQSYSGISLEGVDVEEADTGGVARGTRSVGVGSLGGVGVLVGSAVLIAVAVLLGVLMLVRVFVLRGVKVEVGVAAVVSVGGVVGVLADVAALVGVLVMVAVAVAVRVGLGQGFERALAVTDSPLKVQVTLVENCTARLLVPAAMESRPNKSASNAPLFLN